jgi:hypothetical protein
MKPNHQTFTPTTLYWASGVSVVMINFCKNEFIAGKIIR